MPDDDDDITRGFTEARCSAYGASDVLEFNGKKYTPNETRAFIRFDMSYCFPNALVYKTAVHPHVASISWESLLYQQVNLEHQIQLYKVEAGEDGKNVEDRIVGNVLDATFPPTPGGGWKVDPDPTRLLTFPALQVLQNRPKAQTGLLAVINPAVRTFLCRSKSITNFPRRALPCV